jgi:hypothetical protein
LRAEPQQTDGSDDDVADEAGDVRRPVSGRFGNRVGMSFPRSFGQDRAQEQASLVGLFVA